MPEPTIMSGKLAIANPSDRNWTRNRYLFTVGAYGDTRILVYENDLDDALDVAIDWVADHAPGLLADEAVNEAYAAAIATGKSEEEAHNEATVDTTCGGNAGHYLLSWEWHVTENPSRASPLPRRLRPRRRRLRRRDLHRAIRRRGRARGLDLRRAVGRVRVGSLDGRGTAR